jgi:hypothetical protein
MVTVKRYSLFIGKRVEAQYRVADIHQSSVGTLVSDTGESIFIEERFSQNGRNKTMRVEIPYSYVIRIAEAPPTGAASVPASSPSRKSRR